MFSFGILVGALLPDFFTRPIVLAIILLLASILSIYIIVVSFGRKQI